MRNTIIPTAAHVPGRAAKSLAAAGAELAARSLRRCV